MANNEYSFSLIAEIGSLDKSTLNKVIQAAQKEWQKNGDFKISFRVDEKTGEVVKRVGVKIKDAGDQAEKTSKQAEDASKSIKKIGQSASESSSPIKGFSDGLSDGISKLGGYVLGIKLVNEAIELVTESVRRAVTDVKELNKVMTNVQMVSGSTAGQTLDLFRGYNEIAKELGTTTKYVAEGADSWIRQGKTAAETTELLTASTMQAKIANIAAGQSTEYLTSTLNGYKLQVSDAMHVVDALTAVDFTAATSVDELAIALQKTANSAREAGVEFERTVGYIAAISENTRLAPEIIGTSFRTLFARMQNVKAGKAIDEYGDSLEIWGLAA